MPRIAHNKIHLPDELVCNLYLRGSTIGEIASVYNVSSRTITRVLKENGVDRRPAQPRIRLTGEMANGWKRGYYMRRDGYVIAHVDGARILQHRLVMEKYIGRALRSDEVVHHKDGNHSNNNISNLELLTFSTHARQHMLERYSGIWHDSKRECTFCHETKERSEFYVRKTGFVDSRCKKCKNALESARKKKIRSERSCTI